MSGAQALLGDRAVAVLFETFLHFLWQGALVAGVAALGLGLLRRRGPEVRYAWAVSMMAVLVLLPAIMAFLSARPDAPATEASPTVPAILSEAADPAPEAAAVEPRLPSRPSAAPADRPPLADRAAPWIVSLWLLGAALLLARNLGGWLHLRRRLLSEARPVGGEWPEVLLRLAARLGVRREVRLVRSDRATVPLVAGWLRPVVVLPASLLTGLPAADLEALLAHELAHVRRHDYLVNLLQVAAESALFFHPAVWWLSARIRRERELCCDDLAAAAVGGRSAYARSLATVAGEVAGRRLVAASGGSLLERIRHLTDADPRGPLPSPWAGAALVVAIVLAIALGGRAPLGADPSATGTDPAGTDPAASLSDRWDDAVERIGSAGGWIAWGLSGPAGGSTVVSDTPGGAPDDPSAEVRRAVTTSIDEPAVRDTFDIEAILLEAIFEDGDPGVREDALMALADLPGEAAGAGLRRVATGHSDPVLREQAVQALEDHPGDDRPALLERIAFEDSSTEVREAAFMVLADLEPADAVAGLRRIAREHPDPGMRSDAIAELGDLGTR